MQETLHGVLLGTTRYTEDTLIVHLYTLERGGMSLTARTGGSRTRQNLRRVLAQVPAELEVEVELKPKGFALLRQARQVRPYRSLPYDPCKRAVAMYVAEFAAHLLSHEGADASLYYYLCEALEWLDGNLRPQATANFHILVLTGLTARLGIAPSMEGYCEGMLFDLQEGCFVPPKAGQSLHRLDARQAAVLHLMCTRIGPRSLHLLAMNRRERAECMQVIANYYMLHVPGFQPDRLKSEAVLRELLY